MVIVIPGLVILLLLYSKTDTVLFCKKKAKNFWARGVC